MIKMPRNQRDIEIAAFADGLAIVESFQHRQSPRVLLHLARERVQISRAQMTGERVPAGKSSAGGFHGELDVRSASLRDRRQLLPGRWIRGLKMLAGHRRLPCAVDEMSKAPLVAIKPGERLFWVLDRGTIFHGDKFLGDFAHDLRRLGADSRRSNVLSHSTRVDARCRPTFRWPQRERESR